ncbi:MAG: YigZ family protein [Ruthenibacterium sp.]
MDAYKTIGGTVTAAFTEKKSEFIASASFVETEQAALAFLNDVRAQHRTANHNVYAYSLRDGARMRYSDDGEPAKTAGLPTLEVLRHAEIVDCVIVTTRYFGGILLGTGGLVRAYTTAAQRALAAAKIVSVSVCVRGVLRVPYALYEQAAKLAQDCGAHLEQAEFAGEVTLPFVMLFGTEPPLLQAMQELCRGNADITLSKPYYAPF